MAKSNVITGEVTYPKVFAELVCPVDGVTTQHSQRRVIAHWLGQRGKEWQILVQCAKCRLEYIWRTNQVPEGLKPFHVHIQAHGGHIAELGVTVPDLSEQFTVLAVDRQGALRQAMFSSTMLTSGQLVETFIDGIEERDERY
ncbi:hypothetical protein Q5H93_06150 [Hymenobacter sp. ASUV-10]|uniref:Uncharacterized protein n=1 Tax=Hymenobacter aranciens TaxID=3063996 RepID=A0ABT9B808_9BACT|nr:hypothetical protein [Hymenobacter sp. ASUV-10]MDO7874307.1 hypothetical protein [Hymenobacter sp. ASUV-10]